MIFGVFQRKKNKNIARDWVEKFRTSADGCPDSRQIYVDNQLAILYRATFRTEKYKTLKPAILSENGLSGALVGSIHNEAELGSLLGADLNEGEQHDTTSLFLRLYEKFGVYFVQRLNGRFAFAIFDKAQGKLILGRDRFGIEPLYYFIDEEIITFCSAIAPLFSHPRVAKKLNLQTLGKFLLFNYNPGLETMFDGIFRLRPGHVLIADDAGIEYKRYWKLHFSGMVASRAEEISEGLLVHLCQAVKDSLDKNSEIGTFLSGGMDSSTVLALAAESSDSALRTFSYRCQAESFDESHYARLMAEEFRAKHHEIQYSSNDILLMPDIVREMNEPFCDIGINIATYLLGREASQKVSFVLTGDGGDELFGGHPIYEADKIAQFVDLVPPLLKKPAFSLFASLPDSDKKKNLIVKLKRFSENIQFPSALLAHRWRVYYQPNELHDLLSPALAAELRGRNLFEDVLRINDEADGPDLLSNALYSDYHTVVDFYLRRNDLNRKFGLETRYPLLDHRLVEYCATIPSSLKIKAWFDTKYILKNTMKGILPHEIVYRKDKLGHSIPFKNWIREDTTVKQFIFDLTVQIDVKKRGLFRESYVQELVQDHMARKRNNSHRLWALAVLEMWLQAHYD